MPAASQLAVPSRLGPGDSWQSSALICRLQAAITRPSSELLRWAANVSRSSRRTVASGKPRTLRKKRAQRFRRTFEESGLSHSVAHASYLINLASPDRAHWRMSVNALLEELRRADSLGIPWGRRAPGRIYLGVGRAWNPADCQIVERDSRPDQGAGGAVPAGNNGRPGNVTGVAI